MQTNDKTESGHAEAHQGTAPGAPLAQRADRHAEWTRSAAEAREDAAELWRKAQSAMKKPLVGAGVAGAVVLTAAAVWGASEAAVAAVAAYGAYRVFRRREKSRDKSKGEQRAEGQAKSEGPQVGAPQHG